MKYLLVLIYLFAGYVYAQTGSVKGKVSDGSNPIPSVNILIPGTEYGTSSESNGNYLIKNIPSGDYELRFSAVGFTTKTFSIKILPGKTTELNVKLQTKVIPVAEVQVTGFKEQSQKDTRTSLIDLNPRSAKILPGAVEDVLRTLQSLPGVLAPNDFSSQLIIRGSGPDQNLIIMDDVEIFNPYRLYGVISMFNPDAVKNVNLITGGFPAQYGDRLSAVLDVTNKEGTTKKDLAGSLNASIVDANLVLNGKNPFNLKGSWIIDSRRTYYDLIVEPFVKKAGLVKDNVTFPNFYDIQTKLAIGPYDGNKFLINGIYSRDGVNVVSGANRKTADSVGVYDKTKNDVASFAWHYAPTDKYLNKLVVSWYQNGGLTNFSSEILDPSLQRSSFENAVADTLAPYLLYFKFNSNFTFQKYAIDDKFTYLWKNHILEAGAGMDFMKTIIDFNFDIDPQLMAIFNANSRFRSSISDLKDIKKYKKYRAYVEDKYNITDRLTLQGGLRFDYYDILNKGYIAPRLSFSYALDKLTTLRGMWGIYYQSPGYEKLRDQSVLLDFSKKYTSNLQAEEAIHYILGVERWLNSEWSLRVEGYYKDFRNLIVPERVKGIQYYTERVPGKDPHYASGWTQPVMNFADSVTQIPVNGSYGEAYGIEVFLSKKNIMNNTKLSGWLSYSYAIANRFEDYRMLPFRFDQRNTVNLVLNYQVTDWFDIGIRWQYGSGFPYTQAVGIKPRIILEDRNGDGIPETPVIATRKDFANPGAPGEVIYDIDYGDNRYNARKPAYHRLDVRFTWYANFWNMDWSFYLDVINAYNRKNVIGYNYFVTNDLTLGREKNTMFPIIPTFGFSMKF